MRHQSKKSKETEEYVDQYILDKGVPPTYMAVAEKFDLYPSAAFARCSKFRHKMVSNDKMIFTFSVSVVYRKDDSIQLTANIVQAVDKDQALGICLSKISNNYEGYLMECFLVIFVE